MSSSFVKGERIATLEELLEQEYVMWCYGMKNTKVFHKGWFLSWQIAFAERQIQAGVLFKCRKKVLGKESNQQELDRAIHISVACMMAAIADMGYCEASCRKIWDKAMLYINQVKDGALTLDEIFEMLEEEYKIKLDF